MEGSMGVLDVMLVARELHMRNGSRDLCSEDGSPVSEADGMERRTHLAFPVGIKQSIPAN